LRAAACRPCIPSEKPPSLPYCDASRDLARLLVELEHEARATAPVGSTEVPATGQSAAVVVETR